MRLTIKKALKPLGPFAGFMVAIAFLNALMNVSYPSGDNHIGRLLLICPEILVILILLSTAAVLRVPMHAALYIPLSLVIIFLRLFRFADSLVPAYFSRPFNLYLDSQFFPDLIFLLYSTAPLKVFVLWSFVAVLAAAIIIWGISRALKTIYALFYRLRQGRRLLATVVILVGVRICSLIPWIYRQV